MPNMDVWAGMPDVTGAVLRIINSPPTGEDAIRRPFPVAPSARTRLVAALPQIPCGLWTFLCCGLTVRHRFLLLVQPHVANYDRNAAIRRIGWIVLLHEPLVSETAYLADAALVHTETSQDPSCGVGAIGRQFPI